MSLIGFLINYKWVLLFYLVVAVVVYLNRRKFDVEAKFIYLYRTKIGLKLIDRIASYGRIVRFLGRLSILFGVVGLFWITGFIIVKTYHVLVTPKAIGVAPVLPGLPIAGTGIEFPLIIGWISLFIIIIIHETSHGIVARAFKIPIKSSGIAFFGPILAAFVEPDEKKLVKQKGTVQNAVFAAGPASNVVTSIVFLVILGFVISPFVNAMTQNAGLQVSPIEGTPAALAGIHINSVIVGYNGYKIEGFKDFINYSEGLKPNETIRLTMEDDSSYEITTTSHPDNSTRGFIGINFEEVIQKPKTPSFLSLIGFKVSHWLKELFFWLYFISLNLGLINLFPIFITDGARILQTIMVKLVKDKKRAIYFWKLINQFCVLLILLLMILPWLRNLIV